MDEEYGMDGKCVLIDVSRFAQLKMVRFVSVLDSRRSATLESIDDVPSIKREHAFELKMCGRDRGGREKIVKNNSRNSNVLHRLSYQL